MRSYQLVFFYAFAILIAWSNILAETESANPTVAFRDPQIAGASLTEAQRTELLLELETAIHSTRKFNMLSRDKKKLAVVREEQKFSASEFSAGNAAPSGELLAANYLLLPTITHYGSKRSSRPVPNIDNKYVTSDSGMLALSVQVIDTATGAVRGTYNLKSSFSTGERIANSTSGGPGAERFATMCKDVSAQLANQLIDTVYPTTILKVDGSGLWLNRGANSGVKVGEAFSVYRPGESLIDPATKENLGTTELLVGKAKIVRVNPKASVAKLMGDQSELARVGDILRRN